MLKPYVGRFTTIPSGGFDVGSLLAALTSYLEAKVAGGKWLVRIDDADHSRRPRSLTDSILRTLDAYGFEWDGGILYQSTRLDYYDSVVERLFSQGLAYACTCSCKKLASYNTYPEFCRDALKSKQDASIRIRVPSLIYQFEDAVQGIFKQNISQSVGDFIIKHRDGLFSYQLAVVLDDAMQEISHVVRSADLLDSTPRQLYLQELLGLPAPKYLHIPILVNKAGKKLSKSQKTQALSQADTVYLLLTALTMLGQVTDSRLIKATPKDVLDYAVNCWDASLIPKQQEILSDLN